MIIYIHPSIAEWLPNSFGAIKLNTKRNTIQHEHRTFSSNQIQKLFLHTLLTKPQYPVLKGASAIERIRIVEKWRWGSKGNGPRAPLLFMCANYVWVDPVDPRRDTWWSWWRSRRLGIASLSSIVYGLEFTTARQLTRTPYAIALAKHRDQPFPLAVRYWGFPPPPSGLDCQILFGYDCIRFIS